ncbi:hypothetical protein [Burkholderia sp. 22PA0106]|uniref:hypothetical protein n=1 Tax=Burkholderia sp. 22PA0106 TaxID=3237371 RepID=UPI0039C421B9
MEENWETWGMRSGEWAQSDRGFTLAKTSLGHSVFLQTPDIALLYRQPHDGGRPPRYFPTEFAFSPETGQSLCAAPVSASPGWIPPFGNAAASALTGSSVHGLKRTAAGLLPADLKSRRADADADAQMPNPPPGNYFFCSLPFGTPAHALVAINPFNGELHAWLPGTAVWAPLEARGVALEEFESTEAAWRAELALDAESSTSRLYIPTRSGLACLIADVGGLVYTVAHIGNAPAVGSPLAFAGDIWAPLVDADGQIRFVAARDGKLQAEVSTGVRRDEVGEIGLPVAIGRTALWLTEHGQLRLRQSDGGVTASFTRWPEGLTPCFQFGSPYLSGAGGLWQICRNERTGDYCYVSIERERTQAEISEPTGPRFCSGQAVFRFATRHKALPWVDLGLGDDTGSNEIVIPLVEAAGGSQVIGIRVRNDNGVDAIFERKAERIPFALCFDDNDSEVLFYTASHTAPWRLRLFAHDGMLWAYHPDALRIQGWRLA